MQMTYAERLAAEGVKKGRVEGMRAVVLGQLERRFGPLPGASRAKLEAITTAEELSRLADRVLDARSVEDLGL